MTRANALTLLTAALLMMSGCEKWQSGTSVDSAICDGTFTARQAHAASLLADGTVTTKATGRRLLEQIAAACKEKV